MGFLGLSFGGSNNSNRPPAATSSTWNYMVQNGKVVYTDAMMDYGGDVTGNLEGASNNDIRNALMGKLEDLSVRAREKFIEECIVYFGARESIEVSSSKRMSDADYDMLTKHRAKLDAVHSQSRKLEKSSFLGKKEINR